MPFHKVDSGVKESALQLIAEGWGLERVIETMGVSRRSVDRWTNNYKTLVKCWGSDWSEWGTWIGYDWGIVLDCP
jgi:hypothetical protein